MAFNSTFVTEWLTNVTEWISENQDGFHVFLKYNHIFFNTMHLASNIKYLRGTKNWTQTELAEQLGIDPSTVTIWESGRSAPQFGTVIKLREIFGVNLESLVFADLRTESPRIVNESSGSYHAETEINSRLLDLFQQLAALQGEVVQLATVRERLTVLEEQMRLLSQENGLLLESLRSLKEGKREEGK